MIKIKELEKILLSGNEPKVLKCGIEIFKQGLTSKTPTSEYVKDFYQMGLPSDIMNSYYLEGMGVLNAVVAAKKKLSRTTASDAYVAYTGLLNHEFVIGYDVGKEQNSTAIYTKNKALLERLHQAGAFDNEEKYLKNMKALFGETGVGNKVITSYEKNSLAVGRLDIVAVLGDEISLDLIIPSKFREDYGTTFKLYPYSLFPYLSDALIDFLQKMKNTYFSERNKKVAEIKALTVLQSEPNGDVKTRRVAFQSIELVKAYRRGTYANVDQQEEAQTLLKNQVKKIKIKWDVKKLYLRGYNLEGSLYGNIQTTIRFERLIKILPCSLRDIDTSNYMIDFNDLSRLFVARVNNWHLSDFKSFDKIVDTEDCVNIADRTQKVLNWMYLTDAPQLYKVMKMLRPLFEPETNGNKKTIEMGLDDMYRQKPRAVKHLEFVDLESDALARKKQVQEMLKKGVCKIEGYSLSTGSLRTYYATNCQAVLSASYGPNKLMAYESPRQAIANLRKMVESGKIASTNAFIDKLFKAEIDGLVDYSALNDSSTPKDWINTLEVTDIALQEKAKERQESYQGSNGYLVNFRRINANSEKDFYGCIDVRNIVSVEYGEQKSK